MIESVADFHSESEFEPVIESDPESDSASDADYSSDPASQSEFDFESKVESCSNSDPAFVGGWGVRLFELDLHRVFPSKDQLVFRSPRNPLPGELIFNISPDYIKTYYENPVFYIIT